MASTGMAPVQASERAQQVDQRAAVAKMVSAARARAGGKWFYWIAALSMVNSLAVMAGGNFHFIVGLGVTSVVDAMARQAGSLGNVLDIVINGFVSAVFALFGYFAAKAQKWAFVVGMGLYALDGLLLWGAKDFLGMGFHAYALFAIYRGFQAAD
jgi:hypothetical protein